MVEGFSFSNYMRKLETWAKAYDQEAVVMSPEEFEALYDDAFFEAMDLARQRIMRGLTQEARSLMGLKALASLAIKIAEELRDEATVIDLGQGYGLSSLDLVLEGPSGDLAQGPLYEKACDFNPSHAAAKEDMPIEQAADEIKECVLPLRNWGSLVRTHNLKAIFLSVRRDVGAEKRYLHTRKGKPELPGDPLIMF